MKIVINALSARLGGGQTYLKNLLSRLPASTDLSIVVYAPDALALPGDRRIRRASTAWPVTNPILRTLWERFALPALLKREQAKILFCPGGVVATPVPPGCKTVTMFRNMIPFDARALARIPWGVQKLRNVVLKRAMLRSMAAADLTIFISDYARKVIESLTCVPNPVTIPHGISDHFRTAGKSVKRPSWLPSGEYILYVSKFDVYKHQLEVASAYLALPESLRQRFALLLVGEPDGRQSVCVETLAKKVAPGQIMIAGPKEYGELPAVYAHASAIVFASSCENCPNILLEALGAGKPVMASNIDPMPEFGGDGACYFSPFDVADIERVMRSILEDGGLASRLSSAASERSTDYNWVTTAERTWDSILNLAARDGSGLH